MFTMTEVLNLSDCKCIDGIYKPEERVESGVDLEEWLGLRSVRWHLCLCLTKARDWCCRRPFLLRPAWVHHWLPQMAPGWLDPHVKLTPKQPLWLSSLLAIKNPWDGFSMKGALWQCAQVCFDNRPAGRVIHRPSCSKWKANSLLSPKRVFRTH